MAWASVGNIRGPATTDPYPSYSGVTSGRFDGPGSTFNWKASNTRRMRAALMNAQAESDRCRIVWIGDSATAGYGVTVGVEDHPAVVRRMLTGAGYRVGEIVQFNNNDTHDSRFTYGGSWTVGPKYFPYFTGGTSAWINYTSSVPGTKVYIVCGDVPDTSFTYSIDGASAVTVSPTGGPVGTRIVEVSGLADGFHNVVITSGGISYLAAIGVGYGSTLELMNAGVSQSTAQEWQLAATDFGPNSIAATVSPDVVFINVGANDFGNDGTSVTQIRTYLTNIITQFSATADCILMVPSWPDRPNFDQFFAGLYATAIEHDLPLIDVSNVLGDHAAGVALGLFQADGLHLTPPGNAAVAALQFSALEKVGLIAADQKAFVPKVGNSTIYGDIVMKGSIEAWAVYSDGIVGSGSAPINPEHLTRKDYVDTALSGKVGTGDTRLTNARTPTAHAATHASGGTDAVTPAAIGAAATSHAHAGGDITSGTVAYARLPVGTAASTVAAGDDSRLSDARTPTAHVHAGTDITTGTVPYARLPVGTAASTVAAGNDSRLSDARTPTAHVHAGTDITTGTVAYARLPVGTAASTVAAGDDSRLTNARTPTTHASTHATGGSDVVSPASIGAAATSHTHAAADVSSGTLAAARLPLVTSTPVTVTYSATVAIDPTAGNNFKITATGALALSVSTTGATDGQMVMVEVLASGAARTVTLSGTLTTGLIAANAVASGKTGFFGFRYSALVAGWVLLATTATQ